jgi:predicted nucleic acid-binding protein
MQSDGSPFGRSRRRSMRKSAFWDASAVVPLCVTEAPTSAATSHLNHFTPVVWWGTLVEVYGAICRLHREAAITEKGKIEAVARLEALNRTWREVPAGDQLRELATGLLDAHSLKAADSLQLAASLIWCEERPANRKFISSDQRLLRAARSVGFAVLDISGASSLP